MGTRTAQPTVVTPEHRTLIEQPPAPGARREMAFADERHWVGHVTTEPGADTGWHHHGDYETYVYVIEGHARLEFGPGGRESFAGGPGDFAYVPAGVIHRELNPGSEPNKVVVFRAGTGIPVFPTDGPEED